MPSGTKTPHTGRGQDRPLLPTFPLVKRLRGSEALRGSLSARPPPRSTSMVGKANLANQRCLLWKATLGREALRKTCPSPQRQQEMKVTRHEALMGTKVPSALPPVAPHSGD